MDSSRRAKMVNGIIHLHEVRGSEMKISKKVVRVGMVVGKKTFHRFGVEESGPGVLTKKNYAEST